MRRNLVFFVFFAFAACFVALTSQASAQATRTWVSGVGDDANPCSRTAPCKTFAGAISKTADCGEIDALDPGGYGNVTIVKGIKIDGGGGEAGMVSSILANTASPGIIINNSSATCPFDVIRNLDINGANSGTIGINILQGGTVALENIDIENFTQQCVNHQPSSAVGLTIYNSNFERCTGGALQSSTSSFTNRVVISRSQFSKSQGSGIGLNVGANSKVSVRDSDINSNAGGGVQANGATAFVELQHCQVSNNQTFGVKATGNGKITLAENSITFNNGTGVLADPGAQILTWSNNWVSDNNPDGGRTGTIVPL